MRNFKTDSNQKVVVVHREKCKAPFVYMTKENMIEAYKNLNATALYLFMILASNNDKYEFAFSPTAIKKKFGMPVATCQDQVKKLIENGYLIQRREGSNIYDFYEVPPTKKQQNDM